MKTLCKNDYDKKVCGVCSGIAEYFNLDPSIIRIAWAIFACTGAGILAYIICAVILPNKSQID